MAKEAFEYHLPLKLMKKILQNVVETLIEEGYKEVGGSDVYRLLKKGDENVKIFLKSSIPGEGYTKPTQIVVRRS